MKFNILISFGIVLELLICRSIHAAGFSIVNSVNPYALSVASDGDGDFVVVWDDTPGGDSQIYARAFDARGNARTESFQVNTFNEGDQDSPVVSMRTDGDFVAVWQSAGQDGSGAGVYGRRYSANGMALGDEFLVNGTTTGDQANSRIAMNVTGDFAIVWEGNGIWVRRYGADGFALTGELRVDSPAASPGRHPDVALDASGNFVVVWQRSEGNLTQSVRARRFTKVGEAIGDETTVGAGTLALFPRVDVNLIGDFVVVWKDMNLTKARLFNPDGVAKGDELTVHTGDLFAQPDVIMPANVSMDVAGGFSIVWNAYSAANWSHLSYCQRYDNTGMALGSPAVLSPGGPFPDVALDPQGDTIAVSKAQGGIYAESFPAAMDHAGPLVTDVLINGLSILDGAQIPEAVTNLKLTFSEELAASPGGVNSVVNTANWLLSSEGVEVPGTISRITASFNTNTLKYEAVVVLDGNGEMPGTSALSEGNYTITVRDLVTDFVGNSLDGDYDGTPGGNFSRSFSVLNGSTTTDLLFRQVAAGGYHTVGVKTDGTLWSWGNNSWGQLGDGTTSNKSTPVQVGTASDWQLVVAGYGHTIATKTDGTLWAWGGNSYYQLGDGTAENKSNPVQVGTGSDWQSVVAGEFHTMAIKTDGTLWAWGNNSSGQLGDGTTTSKSSPLQIGTATNWQSVAARYRHTVAVKTDGTLWVWGDNYRGQLGDGTEVDKYSPVQIGTASDWHSVAAGSSHTAAVKTDGTLWAWGGNAGSPVQVGSATDWDSVAAGYWHTVAVKTDGSLWSWGNYSSGQLGDGTTYRISPVRIDTASNWQSVAARYYHTMAIKTDGTLWVWGNNSSGQLGDGTQVDKYSPVQIGTASDWHSVAAGFYHTMAIRTDGTLWAWGYNYHGQLGDGTTTNKSSPVQIGTASDWQSVAAGDYHTVAVKTDGTLWSWGDNSDGQLGDGTTSNKSTPVQIGTASDWHSVAAGSSHTAAVKTDGTLWAWGNNSWGELGDGTTTNKSSPVQIGTGSSWQSVAAGGCLTLAVKTDGTLWAWGRNDYGQLGDGTTTSKSSPLQIGTATNWQSVAAGCWHTVAVKTDGTLWSWGNNLYGQLGDGTPVDKYSPVQIGTATNWQSVAAGEGHTVAVKTDGTLWAWGYNSDGQLGTDLHQTPGKIGAPVVLAQPVSLSAGTLTTATFHIIASGSQPLGYQWRKDGLDLPEGGKFTGVLTPTITIADVQNNDAGNYTVVVANNYGSVTSSVAVLKIKAVATVTLGNLQQTYDGTARSVSVSTAPPGLAVNVTYNGSPSAPTNAGSYTVIATVSDPNYEGSATNTLVVEKTAATVSLGNLFQIYDGTAHRVSVSTTPSGLAVDVTYNGSPAAPADTGSYTVIGTINEVNYRGSATNTLVISLPQGPPSHLTAILGHSSSPAGGLFGYAIWDTLPGGFFNLFLAPGEPGGNPDGLTAPLINGPTDADVAINIALQPGTNTYTIFGSPPWQAGTHMALNLYFDTNRAMLISALAPVKTNAYMPPVVANVSSQTVTLDGSSVPAAGALSFTNVFWSITLAEYFWSNTNVFSVDRVTRPPNSQGGNAVPDGLNDFVGMISLVVAPINHLEVPPSLSISLDPTNGVLAWPGEAANYRLQTCESLSPSVNWLQVTNLPTLSSNRCEIRLPRSDTSQFFRLIKP